MAEPVKKKKKKGGHTGLKILCGGIIAVCLVIVGGAIYLTSLLNSVEHNELDHTDLGLGSEVISDDKSDTSITNIALFGVDQRGSEHPRSDVIIIASVDKRHNKIKVSSIMRDTLVEIEGYGQGKINAAYQRGGPQLAVKTLNQVLGLDIKEYATANFSQMAAIIDAVGGVELDVTEKERLAANISIKEQSRVADLPEDYIKQAGTQTLSGTQAVAFARIRHAPTSEGQHDDFGRTDRQREVIEKLFEKVKGMSVLQYPSFAKKLLPMVETSLDGGELLDLAGIMLREVTFEEARFPHNDDLIGNGSITVKGEQCLNVDLQAMRSRLRKFIYEN